MGVSLSTKLAIKEAGITWNQRQNAKSEQTDQNNNKLTQGVDSIIRACKNTT